MLALAVILPLIATARAIALPRNQDGQADCFQGFDCPATTQADLCQDGLQLAMNDFADLFYTQKNVTAAFDKYVASNYIQHNPNIADGRDAAVAALTPLFSGVGQGFQIARVMVGPEYTTIHINASNPDGTYYSVYDVYRSVGSCLVEHWDCIQQVVINNETVSPHPYF